MFCKIFLFCFDCLLLLMLLALGKKDVLICSCVWWCKKQGKRKARIGSISASRVGSAAPFPLGMRVLQARIARLSPGIAIRSFAGGTLNYQNRGAGLRMARAWAAARSTVPSPRVNQGNRSLVCACACKWATVRMVSAPGAGGHGMAWHGMTLRGWV